MDAGQPVFRQILFCVIEDNYSGGRTSSLHTSIAISNNVCGFPALRNIWSLLSFMVGQKNENDKERETLQCMCVMLSSVSALYRLP